MGASDAPALATLVRCGLEIYVFNLSPRDMHLSFMPKGYIDDVILYYDSSRYNRKDVIEMAEWIYSIRDRGTTPFEITWEEKTDKFLSVQLIGERMTRAHFSGIISSIVPFKSLHPMTILRGNVTGMIARISRLASSPGLMINGIQKLAEMLTLAGYPKYLILESITKSARWPYVNTIKKDPQDFQETAIEIYTSKKQDKLTRRDGVRVVYRLKPNLYRITRAENRRATSVRANELLRSQL